MAPVRVLYVHRQHRDTVGGALRSLHALLEGLSPEGVDPLVLSTEDPLDRTLPGGRWQTFLLPLPHVRKAKSLPLLPGAYRRLRAFLAEAKADLIHLNDVEDAPLFLAARHGPARVPVVAHLRSEHPPRRLRKYHLHKADLLLCVSEAVARRAREAGVPGERIAVVRDTIDPVWKETPAEEEIRETRRRYFPGGAALVVGTVGNISEMKGTDLLVKCAGRAAPHFPALGCLVVGADHHGMREGLGKKALALGFTGLAFAGPLDDPRAAVASMDIAVFPSREEGLGLAVMEAMALGRAVVASRAGGIPELIDDGADGILVPPGDAEALFRALSALLSDGARRAELGKSARTKALARFFSPPFSRRVEEVYSRLLPGRLPASPEERR